MSFRDGARRLQTLARELERGSENVVRLTTDDLYATAIRFSSGLLKPKDLARMDHPYATRHGAPRLNPDIINEDKGDFKRSWRLRVRRRDGDWRGEVFNVDSIAAKFLEPGTRLMFRRSIDRQVMTDVAPRHQGRIRVFSDRLRSI